MNENVFNHIKYGFSIIDLLSGKPINDINILKHISKYSKNTTRLLGDEMNQYLKAVTAAFGKCFCVVMRGFSAVGDGWRQTDSVGQGWEQEASPGVGTGKNMRKRRLMIQPSSQWPPTRVCAWCARHRKRDVGMGYGFRNSYLCIVGLRQFCICCR